MVVGLHIPAVRMQVVVHRGAHVGVAASLTPVISPHDIGPVEMALIPGVI